MTKEAAGYVLLGLGMIGLATLCLAGGFLGIGVDRPLATLLVFGSGSLIYGISLIFGPRLMR